MNEGEGLDPSYHVQRDLRIVAMDQDQGAGRCWMLWAEQDLKRSGRRRGWGGVKLIGKRWDNVTTSHDGLQLTPY